MFHAFCHCELNSTNEKSSIDFFSKLFPDWKLDTMPMPNGNYTLINPPGFPGASRGAAGAILTNPVPGAPAMWVCYIMVEDIHASTAKLEELGAPIHHKLHDVGSGFITIFAEPSGAITGLYQPKPGTIPGI